MASVCLKFDQCVEPQQSEGQGHGEVCVLCGQHMFLQQYSGGHLDFACPVSL